MRLGIEILFLVILIWSIYSGIRQGIVNKTIAIIGLIIALIGGSLISTTFSGQLIPAFEPFASGLAESAQKKAISDIGYDSSEYSLNDIIAENEDIKDDYCNALFQEMGLSKERASNLADSAIELSSSKGMGIQSAAVQTLCSDMLYVIGTLLCSIIIFIILAAIANLINISFHIPNETVEKIGGVIMGIIEGFIICLVVVWVLSFFGSLIGKDTLESSIVIKFVLKCTNVLDIML